MTDHEIDWSKSGIGISFHPFYWTFTAYKTVFGGWQIEMGPLSFWFYNDIKIK